MDMNRCRSLIVKGRDMETTLDFAWHAYARERLTELVRAGLDPIIAARADWTLGLIERGDLPRPVVRRLVPSGCAQVRFQVGWRCVILSWSGTAAVNWAQVEEIRLGVARWGSCSETTGPGRLLAELAEWLMECQGK